MQYKLGDFREDSSLKFTNNSDTRLNAFEPTLYGSATPRLHNVGADSD